MGDRFWSLFGRLAAIGAASLGALGVVIVLASTVAPIAMGSLGFIILLCGWICGSFVAWVGRKQHLCRSYLHKMTDKTLATAS